ncbi:uncharacterized protein LOC110978649 isoform X2 [Acanthaster planci]|uniref:Uncharacterized protein LOC110978649 isoform X2 n=1 Tax=Acanthaster planci TaxID=133434 RepID=A0A8B7YAV6_ACAPL|nr:uncharacterized protein LOC110978649 isoform X2 [Acanthaster planci]XP_022089510.1 uncharacterized protein LOC110978649 isoform X2 [Acanthaster planci]
MVGNLTRKIQFSGIYRGCYFDGDGYRSARIMTDLIKCDGMAGVCQDSCGPGERYCESNSNMTIDFCQSLCRAKNFQYYGLEGGNQCFCGGAFANPFLYGSQLDGNLINCTDPCTGDGSQTCGGEFRIGIYEFQDPVETPGCFFPGAVPNARVMDVGVGVNETLIFTCQPGFELLGESTLMCVGNRTWSSDVLPICNYTGVYPANTTQVSPIQTSKSTAVKPTTENLATTVQDTTSSAFDHGETTKALSSKFTEMPRLTTKLQISMTDYLPYIIGGAAGLLLLLVICMVCVVACKIRKQSGTVNQDIRLKPDGLAPVTLLNTGFSPGEDPETDIPDIFSASNNHPSTEEKEYISQGGPANCEMSTFSMGKNSGSKNDNPSLEDSPAYANMKSVSPLNYPPNPIYESADGPKETHFKKAEDVYINMNSNLGANAASSEKYDSDLEDSFYDRVDGGKKWDSKENLISDNGDSAFFTDPESSAATKL